MSISQKKKKKKMKTFIKTQQEINNLYCPLRTKPKKITKEQWSEAQNYWMSRPLTNQERKTVDNFIEGHLPIRSLAKNLMEESQFKNKISFIR